MPPPPNTNSLLYNIPYRKPDIFGKSCMFLVHPEGKRYKQKDGQTNGVTYRGVLFLQIYHTIQVFQRKLKINLKIILALNKIKTLFYASQGSVKKIVWVVYGLPS